MNYKLILNIMGRVLLLEACLMAVPMLVAIFYRETPFPFAVGIALLLAVGLPLSRLRSRKDFFIREGFAAVGLIWIVLSVFGALPFWISGYFGGYANCLFEMTSGFTTTGASILTDIEAVPKGLLFWRSFSSWIGGMGILIFTLAFLPKVGVRTHTLLQAEINGPVAAKLVPKTAKFSKILYQIYIAFTIMEIVILSLLGFPLYDAVVTTFTTVCTGGYSVMNASIAGYCSPAAEWVIIVFIILGSLNFSLYFLCLTGNFRQALRSDELHFFLIVLFVFCMLVFQNILPLYDSVPHALRDAVFQVSSVMSSTGFCTTDYDLWPTFSKGVLIISMFFGGCSGSTTGSIKCSRILLLLRCTQRSVGRLIHPRTVKVVRLDGRPVNEEALDTLSAFFVIFFAVLGLGCVILSADHVSLTTAFSAALSCLSNAGPGFDAVGPAMNFASLSAPSKIWLSFSMLVGRLEIFPIVILLAPSTWMRR